MDGHKISESEQELFKEVKRVADAERKLQFRETKKAPDDVMAGKIDDKQATTLTTN